MQHNVLAMSGKAVEASGDVNTLLLDKTGTITLGNRQAVEFIPVNGVSESELADAAQLSSLADETPEGRSVVVLAKEKYSLRGREVAEHEAAVYSIFRLYAHERRGPRRAPAAKRRYGRDCPVCERGRWHRASVALGNFRPHFEERRHSTCGGRWPQEFWA